MMWNERNIENVIFYVKRKPGIYYCTSGFSGYIKVTRSFYDNATISKNLNRGIWIPINIYFQSTYFRLKQLFL